MFKVFDGSDPKFAVRWKYARDVGKTVCEIRVVDMEKNFFDQKIVGIGETICCKRDNFCRDTGRKISLLRALQFAGFPKELRVEFWKEYFTMCACGA
jgi:hypothetical protein